MSSTPPRLLAAFLLATPTALSAQSSGLDLNYGYWWHGTGAVSLTAHYHGRLVGPVAYGLGLVHLRSFTEPENVRQTGGELSLALGRTQRGPYLVGAAGLLMGHTSGEITALWSAGAGWTVSPLHFLSLGLEGRYQVEDMQIHGFWRLHPDDLRGFTLAGRVAVRFGGRAERPASSDELRTPEFEPPSAMTETGTLATDGAVPDEPARLRTMVVATALEAMGTPYRWGGNDSNGFDCSGLIQYAYGEHGLILPRTSRDQARTGMAIDRDVRLLLPGDLLGFSVEGAGVTHVGLYVGDGMFIHSASDGVRLSSLTAGDTGNRWWRQRWVTARRVVN
ncbi:MAG: C40 family peptidase [Gemmatimonadota bacterium]|nr:MAG: C40 family peptidase [Gemmatimonadota bacterium]